MTWSDAKKIAETLLDQLPDGLQGRSWIMVDVPGTNYNERRIILTALRRELEKRGSQVFHLQGRPAAPRSPP